MGRQYTIHDGRLRLFDGAATPKYYQVKFVTSDPQLPYNRPRPAQRLVLDRGRAATGMKYVKGPDDPIFEPIEFTFSCVCDENTNRNSLWQALICGTVGSHNWTSTKGTSQLEGVTLPGFAGDNPMQTVNLELLYTGVTSNFGRRCKEVFFPPERIVFGSADENGIAFSATGLIYGTITSISAFTTPNVLSSGGASSK